MKLIRHTHSFAIEILQPHPMTRKLLLSLFLSVSLLYLYGQNGTIKGTVTNKKTGETIPGVNIVILGTSTGTSTDLDGNYTINYAPIGKVTIVASYISFKADTTTCSVSKGKPCIQNIELEEIASSLAGVTIVASKKTDSDISMISTIKQSNLILNGVSSIQISKSQDKDASEVVKRIPGVTIMDDRFINVRGLTERYNNVWLNNTTSPSTETDQRAFSFDIIPSSMIDNILVFKTPAPELPSDFAGASIQIFTKNTSDENHLSFSYQAGIKQHTTFADFYGYKGSSTDWLGFDNGARQLPSIVPTTEEMFVLQDFRDGTAPEIVASRKNKLTEIARSFSKVSTADKFTAIPDNKFGLDVSFLKKKGSVRISNISSLTYKYSFDNTRYYRATYEVYDTVQDQSVWVYEFNDDQYSQNVQLGGIHNWAVSFGNNTIEFRNLINQIGKSRMTYRTGVDYYRSANRVKLYELAYMSRLIYSGQLSGKHKFNKERSELVWTSGFSYAQKNEPDTRRIYTYSARTTNEQGDTIFTPYRLDYTSTINTESNGRLFSDTYERIFVGNLTYDHVFEFGTWQPSLKIGVYLETKNRNFGLRTFGIARATINSQFNQDITYQPIDSIYADTNFNFYNGIKLEENTSPSYSYFARTNITAGFASIKLPIMSNLNLYGGVRAEKFYRLLGGFQDPEVPEPDIIRDTFNIYPSVILTYNISNRSLLRLSYGKTVNHPEYREIAPYAFYDFEQSATVYGNKDLKDSYIHNIDGRFEFYPSLSEMLTLGVFWKSFSNPIEMNLFPASNGWDFVATNSVKGTNYGAEIELRKTFNQLSVSNGVGKVLKNSTFTFNGTIIQGEVEKTDAYVRDKKRVLFGQSPYIVNAGYYYDNPDNGFGFSILYNLFGKRIVVVGTPTIPNIYEHPRNLLDITISKKIGNYFMLKMGVKDILETDVVYKQDFTVTTSAGQTVEREQIMRKYTPGRMFSISLSYSY